MSSLSLITLNIEGSRHLDRVQNFLASQSADVVCLQEVIESDIAQLTRAATAVAHIFAPSTIMNLPHMRGVWGSAIFARRPFLESKSHYYIGDGIALKDFDTSSFESKHQTTHNAVLSTTLTVHGKEYCISTTHFPVTLHGEADAHQRESVPKMLGIVKELGECVLTGDFNAPRGREIFSHIASVLKDNIPEHVTTSIDPSLHRAGALPYMVDGIFSTPGYTVTDVQQHFGVSDHTAFTARVLRT